mmetsp:Transcript_64093/g.77065  ORF Transcript_64093/g.77065 Transcript_64093/m.77065 type:complete len:305 (-) Transcript_64093:217-1131(-)|eukprot:CAMPEP_0194358206 /NCGR_PEP_ID=MMETSP0174-20130528/5498_1 /TAXON_ID=216777 /ORGANISM="Proboscia alata, Strain PI-D3" /LENGTH=304 /DNA_ID=CAMNT_0039128459 /DNA_START=116 /DNA_END=1030 /DNA_ORIENTATION=-
MNPFTRVLSTLGHVSCIGVLATTNLFIGVLDFSARSIVSVISTVTLARIEQDERVIHTERVSILPNKESSDLIVYRPNTGAEMDKGPDQVMDEVATLKATVKYLKKTHPNFDLLGDEKKMTELAHKLISSEFGAMNPDLLADDFQFLFPVVGPLTKDQFTEAFAQFKIREAFPTSRANFHNFSVDPLEPNRIWFMSRGAYEHLGTLKFGPTEFPATGKLLQLPPQVFSMSFDETGKCYKLTGGYNVDRSVGDTGGLGGVFGIVTALGGSLPFPEGKPWKRSLLWEAFSLRAPQIMMNWKSDKKK